MDSETLQHLPKSFQIWQKIEAEAQERAEKRFQEIIKRMGTRQGEAQEQPVMSSEQNLRSS